MVSYLNVFQFTQSSNNLVLAGINERHLLYFVKLQQFFRNIFNKLFTPANYQKRKSVNLAASDMYNTVGCKEI